LSKLNAALALAAKGFKVFPIAAGAKHPPLLNGWPTKATSDPALVEMYWLPLPEANIGIHCEGLVVIDVDIKKGGALALEQLGILYDLPATLCTRTPTGGSHLFFKLPEGHAGVPNSVGQLGAGLDIRSTGGYVVAPGSAVAAGEYDFEHPGVAMADAPDWLIAKLGEARQRDAGADNAVVPDAAPEVVERAREWLKTAERSTKGAGGDQAAYRVAASLRDLGVSYAQACDLMRGPDWDFGCGWRDGKLEDKPIRSAYRYASGEAGGKAAKPEDFPVIVPELGTIAPKLGTGLLSLSDFAKLETVSAGYVIKGLLLRASYAEQFGAPGEGKTFVALDQAFSVAAGREWNGRKVRQGPVLYLAYEGRGGMVKRAKALQRKYGNVDVPLYIVGAALNLREKPGRQELGQTIAAMPAKPVLIVIDTVARALMGGDENSAQDVGAFNTAIAALIESTGACVMIIHHSGKDKSKGARGSSALLGAIDTEIEVDGGQVMARKQRDIEIADPIGFKLVPVVVGMDEDGDETTSCVVEPAQVSATVSLDRISGNAKRGFDVLCALRPDNGKITLGEWRDGCAEFLGGKNVAQRFYDIKKTLLAKGYVVVDDNGLFTRRMQ
jgi:hypothetical protein